jgi:hypothetical protein
VFDALLFVGMGEFQPKKLQRKVAQHFGEVPVGAQGGKGLAVEGFGHLVPLGAGEGCGGKNVSE